MSKTGDLVSVTDEYLLNALNDVVSQQFNVIRVTKMIMSLACGKGDNYFGIIHRVQVSGVKENGEEVQLSFILKIPPYSEEMRDKLPITKFFVREAFIYNVTLPTLCALQENSDVGNDEKYKNISCFKTGIELNKEFLIIQDGCSENFVVPPRTTSFDNIHSLLILKQLAKFHALSFVMKAKNMNEFLKLTQYTGGVDDFEENSYKEVLKQLIKKSMSTLNDGPIKDVLQKFTDNLYEKTLAFSKPETVDGYAVLTHADCWTNNIMIKYENKQAVDCRLIDWQTLSYSSPILDISFFILNCTDEETRREHLNNWIETYYVTLSQHIKALGQDPEKLYPRKIFDDHFKRIFLFGLAMSFVMLPSTAGEPDDTIDLDNAVSDEKREQIAGEFSSDDVSKRLSMKLEGMVKTCMDLKLL